MIFTGQKITTLVSSNNIPGANVRKGSLGYVSVLGNPKFYYKIESLLVPAKIVFTRFGFEKKRRSETKIVFLLFPITKDAAIKNIRRHLNNRVKKAMSMHSILKRNLLSEGVKLNKFDILIVTKTNLESNINTENEFEAWISSIIQSGIFHKLLTLGNKDEIKKAKQELVLGLPEVEESLRKCVKYNGEIGKLARFLQTRPVERLEIIKQFKQYLHLDMRRTVAQSIKKFDTNFLSPDNRYALYWFFYNNNLPFPEKEVDSYHYSITTDYITHWITKFETLNDA